MLSDYNKATTELVPDPYHSSVFTANAEVIMYEMTEHDNNLIVDTGGEVEVTIILPYVSKCRNCEFTIHARVCDAEIIIENRGDSEAWGGPYTLLEAGQQMTFRSTGIKWIVVEGAVEEEQL